MGVSPPLVAFAVKVIPVPMHIELSASLDVIETVAATELVIATNTSNLSVLSHPPEV